MQGIEYFSVSEVYMIAFEEEEVALRYLKKKMKKKLCMNCLLNVSVGPISV